ncbi:MAG: hypothetical protein A3J72_01815 [Nitrospirae bacterium RIFCSPHIGHO2_02_FULL_40_19]|nr:MAG: hypothetical protein A3J72_01815 [Nitrospirae bacterium RIFCSPHIGHO2_02_FULL_40_19]
MNYVLTCSLSFFISLFVAFSVSRLGKRFGLIDNPNERSSHSIATPRGGGVGIWISFIVIGFLLIDQEYRLLIFVVGCIGLLGLINDRCEISSKLRLLFQLILSATIVVVYANISFFAQPPSFLINLFFFLFLVIFISGTANFYNFMDGINGIAGLTGVAGFGLMAAFSFYIADDKSITILSLILLSACLGFLPLNFPNARVFMGDVGSLLLGFIFASFVVKLSSDIGIFLCLIMFLCTFYADAVMTIYHRWRMSENLMKAHRSHLYQYMTNELGLPHWKVSVLYLIVQLVTGLLSIWAYKSGVSWQIIIIMIYSALFVITYKWVKCLKPFKRGILENS